jgi:hypothetical protein
MSRFAQGRWLRPHTAAPQYQRVAHTEFLINPPRIAHTLGSKSAA